jgi:predicted  nucleic acid-binding Zn-ribbon protein
MTIVKQTRVPPKNTSLVDPAQAQHEQGKQSFMTALCEIDELKQTMRYLEIQIAKLNEDKEKLNEQISSGVAA